MTVTRSSVVLVRFPFSSGDGAKLRPALVVQSDRNNRRLRTTVVAMVTSSTRHAAREPTQVLLDVATAAGKQSGLLHTSAVKCENLFTLEQALVLRTIGSLPPATMRRIDASLRTALDCD